MVKSYWKRINPTTQYLARRVRAEIRWRRKDAEYAEKFPLLHKRHPISGRMIMRDDHLTERTRKWLERFNHGRPVLPAIAQGGGRTPKVRNSRAAKWNPYLADWFFVRV